MAMLFCTNRNDFHHEDLYDGVLYQFPPGQKVAITEEAARHMFGFRLPDKTEILTRLGWAMKYDEKQRTFAENPDGVKKLKNFVFSEAVMVEKPAEDLPTDPPTPPEPTPQPDKTLHLKAKAEARV
jgi:hypothetical protein